MAVYKNRLLRKTSSGSYDTVHLETSSDLVKRPSGNTVESDMTSMAQTIAGKASINHTHPGLDSHYLGEILQFGSIDWIIVNITEGVFTLAATNIYSMVQLHSSTSGSYNSCDLANLCGNLDNTLFTDTEKNRLVWSIHMNGRMTHVFLPDSGQIQNYSERGFDWFRTTDVATSLVCKFNGVAQKWWISPSPNSNNAVSTAQVVTESGVITTTQSNPPTNYYGLRPFVCIKRKVS